MFNPLRYNPMPNQKSLRDALCTLLTVHKPTFLSAKLIIEMPHDEDVRISIRAGCRECPDTTFSAMQEAILEALSKHVGDPIVADDLAKLAGYEATGGAWKRALAELVTRGYLENCRPGYRLRTEGNS